MADDEGAGGENLGGTSVAAAVAAVGSGAGDGAEEPRMLRALNESWSLSSSEVRLAIFVSWKQRIPGK